MTNSETAITSALDEPLALPEDNQRLVFSRVDALIKKAHEEGDPLIAIEGVSQLTGFERIVGLAKAKLLWSINKEWKSFGLEESFRDFVMEHSSLSVDTLDRYILAWEMYAENKVPKKYLESIMSRTMRDQVEIAKIADRVTLKDKDWKEISDAANGREIAELKHRLTGSKPRKSGTMILLHRNGDLEVRGGDEETYHIGYLEADNPSELVQKAVNRIVQSSGILKQ